MARQRHHIKDSASIFALSTNMAEKERAAARITRFAVAQDTRLAFKTAMQKFPPYVQYWRKKGVKVRKMLARKRKFLKRIFEREKRTLLAFYQGKKKFKKTLQKLQSMK